MALLEFTTLRLHDSICGRPTSPPHWIPALAGMTCMGVLVRGGSWGWGAPTACPFIPFEGLRTGFDFPQHERAGFVGTSVGVREWGRPLASAPALGSRFRGNDGWGERRWGGTTVGVWCGRGSRCRGTGGSRTAPTARVGVRGWFGVGAPRLAAPLDSCLRRNDARGGAAARQGLGDGGPAPGYRPPPVWSAWGCVLCRGSCLRRNDEGGGGGLLDGLRGADRIV